MEENGVSGRGDAGPLSLLLRPVRVYWWAYWGLLAAGHDHRNGEGRWAEGQLMQVDAITKGSGSIVA